jgi:putative heme iron utilization protein
MKAALSWRSIAAALAGCTAVVAAQAQSCASQQQQRNVQAYYANLRPGVPATVASRYFNLAEAAIHTALPAERALLVAATPALVRQLWQTVDAWGASSRVYVVLSPAAQHGVEIPSAVPTMQADASDGYLDLRAAGSDGLAAHVQLDAVAAVGAIDVPADKAGFRTRGVSLFGRQGEAVFSVYASIKDKPVAEAAVAGFARSWQLLARLPPLCKP